MLPSRCCHVSVWYYAIFRYLCACWRDGVQVSLVVCRFPWWLMHRPLHCGSRQTLSATGVPQCTLRCFCAVLCCAVPIRHAGPQAVATDGDGDLVQLARRNLPANAGGACYTPRAAVLPWGDDEAAARVLAMLDAMVPSSSGGGGGSPRRSAAGSGGIQSETGSSSTSGGGEAARAASVVGNAGSNSLARVAGNHRHAGGEGGSSTPVGSGGWQGRSAMAGCTEGGGAGTPTTDPVDVVLLSDVVYGSNPGVWERLVATLRRLCGPGTVVLQCESPRIEGVLYSQYWEQLGAEGFRSTELLDVSWGHDGGGEGGAGDGEGGAAGTAAAVRSRAWVVVCRDVQGCAGAV